MHMLRKTMGMAMPMRLAMEKKVIHNTYNMKQRSELCIIFKSFFQAANKVGHLPCISVRSMASLDALTGADNNIGFDDQFGKMENFEMMTDSPFNVVNKYLDENRI